MSLFQYANSTEMWWARVSLAGSLQAQEASAAQWYRMLEMYYNCNGLYEAVQQQLYENAIWAPGMKPFYNPAHRAVEFYVSKLWPGQLPDALPIQAENERIVEPVQQVWRWSNWSAQKQLFIRWFALFGDGFIKVVTRTDGAGAVERVYLQVIKPEYVIDLDADERDYLTYVRIDVPQVRRNGDKTESYTHTEIWDKAAQLFRIYEHTHGCGADINLLGNPSVERPLSDFGIDFVPVVHAKFQDTGEKRGAGVFVHVLDKIDEANRMATRLHQILYRYNKPTVVVMSNAMDAAGRPMPPPLLPGQASAGDDVTVGDDEILSLPGKSTMDHLVPNLNYEAALLILQDQMQEIERDLPELAYFRLRETGRDLSGRAVRLLLSDAIDKATEARGNALTALARADAMALTIGQNAGLFSSIGDYDAGDFEHDFTTSEIIQLSDIEILETVQAGVNAGIPLVTMLRRVGWSVDDLEQMAQDKSEAQAESAQLAQAYLEQARRNFDQGNAEDNFQRSSRNDNDQEELNA